jgi:hypothetical protein
MRFMILQRFAVLLCSIAAAQEPGPPRPGDRVRVTLIQRAPLVRVGVLASVHGDALGLDTPLGSSVIPLATIRSLELSRGRRPNVPLGVAGLVLGAAAGGAVGCLANRDSYGVFCAGQDDTKVIAGAVAGGVVLGAVGALVFRRERWATVDLAFLRGGL